jgi:diguanylate cyclase (GGDEF)-like protein/PAS domain S-box-containing protein
VDQLKSQVCRGGVVMKNKTISEIVQQMADSVVVTDRDGRINYVNGSFEKMTGFAGAEVFGSTPRLLKSGLHGQGFYRRMWKTLLDGKVFRDIMTNRRKNGELYYEEKTITPVHDASGAIVRFVSVGRDVTARIETQRRLEHLAYRDVLTGLPNRALFLDRLKHAIAGARRRRAVVAVFFIDLDGFKEVNDRWGHETGDKLLRSLAGRLRTALRDTDTVARLGGDEFAVLLEDVSYTQDVALAAQKLLDLIATPLTLIGTRQTISASIGVSLYPRDGVDAATLLRNSDKAMYVAKAAGKHRVQFYGETSPPAGEILQVISRPEPSPELNHRH